MDIPHCLLRTRFFVDCCNGDFSPAFVHGVCRAEARCLCLDSQLLVYHTRHRVISESLSSGKGHHQAGQREVVDPVGNPLNEILDDLYGWIRKSGGCCPATLDVPFCVEPRVQSLHDGLIDLRDEDPLLVPAAPAESGSPVKTGPSRSWAGNVCLPAPACPE